MADPGPEHRPHAFDTPLLKNRNSMSAPPRQVLSVDVGELRHPIETRAAAEGLRPGPWIRRLVTQALSDAPSDGPTRLATGTEPSRRDPADLVKFTARLTTAQATVLARRAAQAGLSRTEFLARLLMDELPIVAPMDGHLSAALIDHNHQLVALGRNLNQIARNLNAYPGRMTASERDFIVAVTRTTREHVERMARFLAEQPSRRPRPRACEAEQARAE